MSMVPPSDICTVPVGWPRLPTTVMLSVTGVETTAGYGTLAPMEGIARPPPVAASAADPDPLYAPSPM